MRKIILALSLFLLALTVFCQTKSDTTEFNLGFEKTTFNQKLPDNWFQWGTGYNISIDTITKYSGKTSVSIAPFENRPSNSFGCIAYKIPAIYVGKEIELRAYIKMENVKEGPIGLMLRIDGASGVLQFDNMQKKNVQGTSDWSLYSVKLPYPDRAKTIIIGALLSGTGRLWVDNFELLIDGKNISDAKQKIQKIYKAEKDVEFDKGSKIDSITVTDKKINDLKLLGMVWGFLKYYHPNISAGEYNWDYELFRILPKILQSKNMQDRDAILTNWIIGLGTFQVNDNLEEIDEKAIIQPDLDWITNINLSRDLAAQLVKVKNAQREGENYYIGLFEGVGNPEFKNENAYSEMKCPDVGFRLLSLYRYWNNIQYFYPYKNLIEEDWKDILKEFIPKYINATTEIDYKLTSLELIARIHDTHANIYGQDKVLMKYRGINYAPFEIKFVENKAVVTNYYEQELGEKSGLKVGDVITSINYKPVKKIILEKLKYAPASNYPTQLSIIAGEILRTNDTIINIEFTREGVSKLKKIKTYSTDKINIYRKYQSKDTCFKFISYDIAYLYAGTLRNIYLPEIMSKIQNTKGLIIDLRCYPSEFVVFTLGKYLVGDSSAFVKFSIGSIARPGLFTMTPNLSFGGVNKDHYKGKIVILINETTLSQAEYTAMAFRTALKATVVGSTTAGADGNISQFYLPGGISTAISGIGIYYPDGSVTQRIGIVPDIEVKPTIKGIIKGRDEVLEEAIKNINTL